MKKNVFGILACTIWLASCTKEDITAASCNFDEAGGEYMNPSDRSAIIVLGTFAGINDTVHTVSSSGSALFVGSPTQNAQVGSFSITINEGTYAWNWLINAYLFTYTMHDIGNQPVTYNITGAGDLPSATVTDGVWPSYPIVTSPTAVTRSEGYTVTLDHAVANAEHIYVEFKGVDAYGQEKVVAGKLFDGNATSLHFSASDLSCLTAGTGGIAVQALHRFSTTANGKAYYFYHFRQMLHHVTFQ